MEAGHIVRFTREVTVSITDPSDMDNVRIRRYLRHSSTCPAIPRYLGYIRVPYTWAVQVETEAIKTQGDAPTQTARVV